MTHFYQCEGMHWCASDEKIIESEWGLAVCSQCNRRIIRFEHHMMPPSTLSSMPCVRINSAHNTVPLNMPGTSFPPSISLGGNPFSSTLAPFIGAPFSTPSPSSSPSFGFASSSDPMMAAAASSSMAMEVTEYKQRDDELYLHHRAVIKESESQAVLYEVLQGVGYTFLRRDKNFGAYNPGSESTCTVPEPGVTGDGAFTVRQTSGGELVIGREENPMAEGYCQAGRVSYPDYFVMLNSVFYAIELKTPRVNNFKIYMSDTFWTDKGFGGRSIENQLTARKKLMGSKVMQILLFDVRNMSDLVNASADAVLTDLKNSICHLKLRRAFFEATVNGVMLYNGGTYNPSKLFSMSEILSGAASKGTQTNILSFLKK